MVTHGHKTPNMFLSNRISESGDEANDQVTMKTNEVISVRELTDLPEKVSFVKRKNSLALQKIEEENAL